MRMTDEVVTDATFASRSGLYDFDGNAVRELAGPALGKLPERGGLRHGDRPAQGRCRAPSSACVPGIPVVIGAGDRQCEVLGSGASEECPMVSWGTTANVSVPVHERPVPSPAGAVVTRGADGGWLLEGGLSAAGSFLAWLGRLLGRPGRRAGGPGRRQPAGRPRGDRRALARRGPRPVVARRRPGRLRRAGRRPRRRRPGPGRDRVGGLGRAALHGGGDRRPARRQHGRRASRWVGPGPGSRCGSRC